MEERLEYLEGAEQPIAMHPKKFALWLFIVSTVMVFAALTSAYIVRQAEGNWLEFDLPNMLFYSTVIIAISSGTMHWAYLSAKKDDLNSLKLAMGITTVLGIAILTVQWYSLVDLVDRDVYFVGNPAGSFLYVFTGLHALHLISGVIFLIIVLISSFRYQIHSKSMNRLEI
jgi:cytochrome c oxidase subunit III